MRFLKVTGTVHGILRQTFVLSNFSILSTEFESLLNIMFYPVLYLFIKKLMKKPVLSANRWTWLDKNYRNIPYIFVENLITVLIRRNLKSNKQGKWCQFTVDTVVTVLTVDSIPNRRLNYHPPPSSKKKATTSFPFKCHCTGQVQITCSRRFCIDLNVLFQSNWNICFATW